MPLPSTQPTTTQKKSLGFELTQVLFSTLVVLTPIIGFYTGWQQKMIHEYKTNGVVVEATVGEVSAQYHRRYTLYTVDVSFFTDGDVLDGAYVSGEVRDVVNRIVVESLQEKEQVVYLKNDPEKKVIFEKSLHSEYWAPIQKWNLTIYLGIGTVVSFVWMRLLRKKQKG